MKEDIYENKWDKLLKIHTMGRDDSNAGQYYYPYEPTPYSVLERLANTGIIRKGNMPMTPRSRFRKLLMTRPLAALTSLRLLVLEMVAIPTT